MNNQPANLIANMNELTEGGEFVNPKKIHMVDVLLLAAKTLSMLGPDFGK